MRNIPLRRCRVLLPLQECTPTNKNRTINNICSAVGSSVTDTAKHSQIALYGYINKPTATTLQPNAKRNKNRFAQNCVHTCIEEQVQQRPMTR